MIERERLIGGLSPIICRERTVVSDGIASSHRESMGSLSKSGERKRRAALKLNTRVLTKEIRRRFIGGEGKRGSKT